MAVAVLAGLWLGWASTERPAGQIERRADIGRHRLAYRVLGQGSPLVIIEVGIGDSAQAWAPLADSLAKRASVLFYDRAGYGRSETGPPPRDARSEAADLAALLQQADLKGPYILVGHSLGALNVQVYAHEHPEGVAGMVLLDPPPRDWLSGSSFPRLRELFLRTGDELAKAAQMAEKSDSQSERNRALFLRTLASEHKEMLGNTARQVSAVSSFGDLPLTVIAAGKPNPAFGAEADAFQKYWIEECRKLSRLSSAGNFILAAQSGHQLHRDAPETVLAAVEKLLGAGRRKDLEIMEKRK